MLLSVPVVVGVSVVVFSIIHVLPGDPDHSIVWYRMASTQPGIAMPQIGRSLVGNYITSLEMPGCSITVCRLTPQLTELWDAPVETPALRWGR